MEAYTCPMDPEIVKKEPGKCPKCGMNLRPMGHGGHENMEESFKKRFLITFPLTIIVLLISPHIQDWFRFSIDLPAGGQVLQDLILFVITSVIVFWAGWPFYQMAKAEIRARAYGMMTLVSLAVLAGYLFSVAATFLFPGENLYWEVSTLVLAFLFGHWMEMRAVRGATGALSELAKLIPPTAHLIVGKGIENVGTEKLKKGDKILVRPGEKIPIDGIVIDGESSINESMVTGESKPVGKEKGSEVIGGTINNDGSLTIEVTKTGEQTAISQMMELIRKAQESKPAVQKIADRAASMLTFTALTVGIGTFIYWFLISPQGAVFASTLAISVIVIACPHALGLAIPTVTTITNSLAARNGILIKDMTALEIARKLNYIVFDKTGTLTEGKFGVVGNVNNNLLALAASVEAHSQHSIAQAIVDEAKKRKLRIVPVKNFKSYPGKGAEGIVNGKKVLVGNEKLMEQFKVVISESKLSGKAATVISIAIDGKFAGSISLEDIIRLKSKAVIQDLKNLGIKTAMLTGDNEAVAKDVSKKLGIDTYFARVLPEEKVEKIKQLQKDGSIVAMVGDGVNDAPSLTQAHVGIAIGAGTDVAVESAEIVLVKNDPQDIVKIINLSQKTNNKMVQNLAWAAGYNIITIPLAAGILYGYGILLRPEWAALLMSASSIIVVFNALLLRREQLG